MEIYARNSFEVLLYEIKPCVQLSIQHVSIPCPLGLHHWNNSLCVCILNKNDEELWNFQQFWVALAIFLIFKIFDPILLC